MKKFYLILIASLVVLQMTFAQRYSTEVFTDVKVTQNVVYGTNATILFIGTEGETVPQPLIADIYEPEGDTETERPLVLVFHTGNFLPPVTNGQIAGTIRDSSVVEICTQLARRGFVAASCDYRTGWNPLAATQPERALGLIQAAYRGVQDGRTAVRFFKRSAAEDGNPFGIDSEKVTAWGTGTGGYLVLGMNGLSNYNEIIFTTNGPGKFSLDLDMDGMPETPMVVEAFHGDIEGKVLTVVPANGFGLPAGDTTNYPNHVDYSSDIELTVNVGGALGDISWLNDQTVPAISIQSANDIFAPYDDAVLIVPTTGDPITQVQGAQQIGAVQEANGINQPWKDAMFNDPITIKAMANSATAGHPYYEGTFPIQKAPNMNGIDEGVVINWWNPTDPAPGQGMGIPWNMLPHPSGGTFHDQGLALNEGMSAAKSRANIDTIMQYVIPRMMITLGLDLVNTENIPAAEVGLVVAPNPAMTFAGIQTNGVDFEVVRVFDLQGKLVRNIENLNTSFYRLDRGSIPNGMYVVQLQFENGISTQKLIFN